VLLVPLQHEFGWSRAVLSTAVGINLSRVARDREEVGLAVRPQQLGSSATRTPVMLASVTMDCARVLATAPRISRVAAALRPLGSRNAGDSVGDGLHPGEGGAAGVEGAQDQKAGRK
jgi:hypothetical protein